MFDFLLAVQTMPFTTAIAVMLMIAMLEGVGLLLGAGLSSLLESILPDMPDADIEIDMVDSSGDTSLSAADLDAPGNPGPFVRFLGWLHVGRVPVLILLVVLLTSFGLIGLTIQNISLVVTGYMLPAFLVVLPAFILALPTVRWTATGLAAIMPRDETEAVSKNNFVGRMATLTQGNASKGEPAQAKLTDKFGKSHYVQIEPDNAEDKFDQGQTVLITSQNGHIFLAIQSDNSALTEG